MNGRCCNWISCLFFVGLLHSYTWWQHVAAAASCGPGPNKTAHVYGTPALLSFSARLSGSRCLSAFQAAKSATCVCCTDSYGLMLGHAVDAIPLDPPDRRSSPCGFGTTRTADLLRPALLKTPLDQRRFMRGCSRTMHTKASLHKASKKHIAFHELCQLRIQVCFGSKLPLQRGARGVVLRKWSGERMVIGLCHSVHPLFQPPRGTSVPCSVLLAMSGGVSVVNAFGGRPRRGGGSTCRPAQVLQLDLHQGPHQKPTTRGERRERREWGLNHHQHPREWGGNWTAKKP